jgi:uncharacterized phage protein (TIGR02218 family)
MKQISAALAGHLIGETTTLASCWKLTRRDATVFGFTDHDQDILFESVTYKASTGFTPSAIENNSSLGVDNLDIEGMLSDSVIKETDILAGKYDFAEIEIFQVNYNDLTQGALKLRRGWLGEVSMQKHQFVAEVRGLVQRLSQTIGELFSPSCRATLGDSRCTVNLTLHTVGGSVTTLISNQEFKDSARTEDSGVFSAGILVFTSGANNGLAIEVKEYTKLSAGGQILLTLPMPYPIAASDTYNMSKGCDKTMDTCFNQFSNIVNFRGEPSVPGLDRMLETAGTKSNW